jgi:AraC family transcriptional regulator
MLVRSSSALSLDDLLDAEGAPRFLICRSGPDSTLSIPAGAAALCWALRGQAHVVCGDAMTSLNRRSILISDAQRPADMVTGAPGVALAIVAAPAQWRDLMLRANFGPNKEPIVFPALHEATRRARHNVVRALRGVEDDASVVAALALAEAINDLQRPFEPLIRRCPGRSLQQKRMVFMRLQRVRTYLVANTHRVLTIKSLALIANYSVWRFIRIYRAVFGETPYAAVSRHRIEQASVLLHAEDECIGDVATAVGFESRSALTRALKKRFGINATQLRMSSRRAQRPLAPASGSSPVSRRQRQFGKRP